MSRIASALAVIVAGLRGIYTPGYVAQVVAFTIGLTATRFFPILLLSFLTNAQLRKGRSQAG